jgi:uncharacterized protein (TIGR03066 family)
MRSLCVVLAGLLVLTVVVRAEEAKTKIDKSKLVGTWTFVKTDGKTGLPPGATLKVEFTKDGKVIMTFKLKEDTKSREGTYKVDGDQLSMTFGEKGKESKDVITIKELTDKKFVSTEKKKDKVETAEFKRDEK